MAEQSENFEGKKIRLQLPRGINVELVFVDPPETTGQSSRVPEIRKDANGNFVFDGCGCQGNCICGYSC